MITPTRYLFRALALLALGLLAAACAPATPLTTDDPFRPAAIEAQGVPVVPPQLIERLRQYQAVRSAGFAGWSSDGKGMIVRTRFADTAQLHHVAAPGASRQQLTFFGEPVSGRAVPRDPNLMLLRMSTGGDENYQLHRFERDTGQTTRLTDGVSRHTLHAIEPNGRRFVYTSNQRNGRDNDLYLMDPRHPDAARLLMAVDGAFWYAHDFSPDGKHLLLIRYVSVTESRPAIFDIETGRRRWLPTPTDAVASYSVPRFSHDGRSVYLTTDAHGEFRRLARLDLHTGRYTTLTADIPWNVEAIAVDRQSGRLALTTNEDGATGLYVIDDGARRKIDLPMGRISALEFSPDGERLGFNFSRFDAPTDAYDLRLSDGKLTRWTFSEVGGLDTATFVQPQLIRYTSFDGRSIPAYYFKPLGASAQRPAPVVVDIHGGPEGQRRPGLSTTNQFYLLELGYAVLQPNVRGSTGYGKTYTQLDNAERREDSVKDIGALLDWIAEQDELDADRVAVRGGSYGGYMVLASLIHYGDRLRAGIDVVGIANFQTFLKNTADYRRDLRRVEYGDERDPAMARVFERINPTANAHKIRSALLVVHGKNDPRVPFSEAEQIARIVRAHGRTVWTVFADNEGHGFAKKPNRDYYTAVVALFLQTHLGKP